MTRKIINTPSAPAAIGMYSQAVVVGNLVFISGQIPLDPKTNHVINDSFESALHQVLKNLQAICEAAGGDLDDVVKLNVYLKDLNNFSKLNEVMGQYFEEPYPARAAVEVSRLPKDAMVEIDAVLAI